MHKPFEYFHLANDAELEEATNNMVVSYERYHPPKSSRKISPSAKTELLDTWNEGKRRTVLKTYRDKIEALRMGEQNRMAAFTDGDAYDDLRVSKAYQSIPLYDTLQQRGSSDKGGPYGFAKAVSDDYGRPGHRGQARFDAEGTYIKNLVGKAGLTKDEMSKIMVHTGRRSQSGAEHGLEFEMFTSK